MALGIMGNSLLDRSTYIVSYNTNIDLNVPAPCRGIIKSWGVYARADHSIKLKVFRDDGTYFRFIGESPYVNVTLGLCENLPAWIPVEKGDLIAFYWPEPESNLLEADAAGSNNWATKSGDITSDSLKSSWSFGNAIISIQAKIFTRVALL